MSSYNRSDLVARTYLVELKSKTRKACRTKIGHAYHLTFSYRSPLTDFPISLEYQTFDLEWDQTHLSNHSVPHPKNIPNFILIHVEAHITRTYFHWSFQFYIGLTIWKQSWWTADVCAFVYNIFVLVRCKRFYFLHTMQKLVALLHCGDKTIIWNEASF